MATASNERPTTANTRHYGRRVSPTESTLYRRHNSQCNQLTQRCIAVPYITGRTAAFCSLCTGGSSVAPRSAARLHSTGTGTGTGYTEGQTGLHGNISTPAPPPPGRRRGSGLWYTATIMESTPDRHRVIYSAILKPVASTADFDLWVGAERVHAYLFVCTYQQRFMAYSTTAGFVAAIKMVWFNIRARRLLLFCFIAGEVRYKATILRKEFICIHSRYTIFIFLQVWTFW